MKLYYFPGACSLADHIVLEWIGKWYQAIRMDQAGSKEPAYLALNPAGAVPVLQHGDFVLTENVAILGYLSDLNPEAALAGDGSPRARAEVMRWLGYLNSDVHSAFRPIFSPSRFLLDGSQRDLLAQSARTQLRAHFERLDTQLAGRNWLTGHRSLADPYLFVVTRWAMGTNVDLAGLDNLARFMERMSGDAGVQAAVMSEEGRANVSEPRAANEARATA